MESIKAMKALWKVQKNIINKCFHNLEMDANTPPALQLGLQNLRKQLSTLNEKNLSSAASGKTSILRQPISSLTFNGTKPERHS